MENTQTEFFSWVKYWKFHDWNLKFVNVISLKYNTNFSQLKTDPIGIISRAGNNIARDPRRERRDLTSWTSSQQVCHIREKYSIDDDTNNNKYIPLQANRIQGMIILRKIPTFHPVG